VVETSRSERLTRIAAWAGAAFLAVVFLKNAWACDDAYITFRSIEQLFAGHGPRWNPHERVQVFSSPLWYGTLGLFRIFSSNVFLNAIAASALAFFATLFFLRRVIRDDLIWLLVMLVLVASNGFFDYTTSGLENPLCFLVLSVWLLFYFRLFDPGAALDARRRDAQGFLICVGLLLLCRYDLMSLVIAPALFALDRNRSDRSGREWLRAASIAFAPFLAWALFALVYYGTIFPNPAYAKLWTGIPQVVLWKKGLLYLVTVARHDVITIVMTVFGAAALLFTRRNEFRALGVGVLLNVFYVVSVGGDFMLGRFLSHAFLVTAVALAVHVRSMEWIQRRRVLVFATGLTLVYWFAWPHTPVNSPLVHRAESPDQNGFADERGIYNRASLWAYIREGGKGVFPNTKWAHDGFTFSETDMCCSFNWAMGFYGYWAGTDKRIVDLFAICDPFTSHLPVTGRDWRIGHFPRQLPEGYLETVNHQRNMIVDPEMHMWYDTVYLVTQSPRLFAPERLRAIVAYNLPR